MLVPSDGSFVEIHKNLFGLEVFLEAPGAELAAEAGLLIPAPGRFDIGGLHVVDPDDAGTQRFYDAKGFVDIAGPDGSGQAVRRIVGDANGVGFGVEGNYRGDGTKNFFASDARGIFDVVENGRLDVIAFAELLWAAA